MGLFGFGKSKNKSEQKSEGSFSSEDRQQVKSEKIFKWNKIFNFSRLEDEFFEDLEEQLILADIGGGNVVRIMDSFRKAVEQEKIKEPEAARQKLRSILTELLIPNQLEFTADKLPVICFIGVNGVGKTTTLAKVAGYYKSDYQVVIGAGDTYRAAASLQIEEWGRRLELPVVSKGENTDAAAVAFDTIESARSKHSSEQPSMALIDTAGRLQNKDHLIDQLNKLIRVCDRFQPDIDRKNILVLDATLGQIGFEQVKIFQERVGVDGIILTKIDTRSKGGIIVSISETFKLPIFFVTYGEKVDQIKEFSIEEYIDSIV